MRLPRAGVLLGALVVASALAAAFLPIGGPPPPPGRSGDGPLPEITAAGAPPPQLTLLGPDYDPASVRSPTRGTSQSKLWFADGRWWGILLGSNAEARIHDLDLVGRAWRDSGTLVDERAEAIADALWDGRFLTVATAGRNVSSRVDALRLVRFSYEPAARRYVLDADFPVLLTDGGVRSAMLARDSADRLWVAYSVNDRLYVDHAGADDHLWRGPIRPGGAASTEAVSGFSLLAIDGMITLLWTARDRDGIFITRHDDDDPDDVWRETRLDLQGVAGVADQLTARAVPGPRGTRLLLAVRTALDKIANPNSQSPLLLLVVVEPDGSWQPHLFGRVSERHVRPLLLVDTARDRLYLAASGPSGDAGRAIYYKDTDLSDIAFAPGAGATLVAGLDPLVIDDATSTKQDLGDAGSLVVLASDNRTGRYVTGTLAVGNPPATRTPEPPSSGAPGASTAERIVADTFDPWPPGSVLGNGWVLTGGGHGSATIARTADRTGNVARLVSGGDGSRARACRKFPPTSNGRLRVTIDLRLEAYGGPDASIEVRGHGADAASVRFDDSGMLAYLDGPAKVSTQASFRTRVWYRSIIELDLGARTYDWGLTELTGARRLIRVEGVAWPSAEPMELDQVCVETPGGAAGIALAIDQAIVER